MRKLLLIACLPLLAYVWVFFGYSVGEDCVSSLWGNVPGKISNYFYCQQQADTGAYVWQHIPEWKEIARNYLSFSLPWWNPHVGAGVPLAANFISGAFNLSSVIAGLDPTLFFGRIWLVFRLCLGLLGMVWLLKQISIRGPAAWAGGVLFVFNGYITILFSINHHDVDMYLPWILATIFAARKEGRFWCLAGLLLGLSLLAGMPESTTFVWTAALALAVFLAYRIRGSRKLSWLAGPVVMILLGLMVGAILLIPGLEYIKMAENSRTTVLGSGVFFTRLRNFLFFPLPKIFGPFHNLISKDASLEVLNLNYWGIIAFILIIFSFFKKRSLSTWLLWIMIAFYFGVIRFPWSIFPIWRDVIWVKYSLGLINLLAAVELARGITAWGKVERDTKLKVIIATWVVIPALLSLFIVDWWRVVAASGGLKAFGTIAIGIGVLTLSIFLTWLLLRTRSTTWLFALVTVELFLYLPWFGARRWGITIEKPAFVVWLQNRATPFDRIFGLNGHLYPNWSGIYGLSDIRFIGPLWPRNYYRYIKEFIQPDLDMAVMRFTSTADTPSQRQAKIDKNIFLDLLSVRYLISNSILSKTGWPLVYDGEEKIYENTSIIPRFRFVEKTICADAEESMIEAMKSNETILSTAAVKLGGNCRDYFGGEIVGVKESSGKIEIKYSLIRPGYLVISDNWYPGWQAMVDSKELIIDRVNLTMRGVELPEGKNILILSYTPTWERLAIGLTIVGLSLSGLGFVFLPRKKVTARIS